MKLKRNQDGMTLMSFIVVLAVVGFALYVGMKLFPMYEEYYSTMVLKGIASETATARAPSRRRSASCSPSVWMSTIRKNVKPSDLKFGPGEWRLEDERGLRGAQAVDCQPRRGDGKFEAHQDLNAGAGE